MKRYKKFLICILTSLLLFTQLQINVLKANDEIIDETEASEEVVDSQDSSEKEDVEDGGIIEDTSSTEDTITSGDVVDSDKEATEPSTDNKQEEGTIEGEESKPEVEQPLEEPKEDTSEEQTQEDELLQAKPSTFDFEDGEEASLLDDASETNDSYVAYIGEKGYATINDAIYSVEANGSATITLASDITLDNCIWFQNRDITIDGQGHTVTRGDINPLEGGNRVKYNPAMIEFNGSLTLKNITLDDAGNSVRNLSREYGTSEVNIRKWIKRYSPITTSSGEVTSNDEIIKLKKQLAKTTEENEILKKALAIFSRQ